MRNLEQYLGKSIDEIKCLTEYYMQKFREADNQTRTKYNLPLLDYLIIAHNQRELSLRDLEKELGIPRQYIAKVFDNLELPRLTKKEAILRKNNNPFFQEMVRKKIREHFKDPEHRIRISEGIRKLWQNPEYKEKRRQYMSLKWKDPEYKKRVGKKIGERKKEMWQNPEIRERIITKMRKARSDPQDRKMRSQRLKDRWKNPEFRKRFSEKWKEPEYRGKRINTMKEVYRRPGYRERKGELLRKSWKERGYVEKRKKGLKTIRGYRKDIGFYAKSAWEANIARILLYCGRDFLIDFPIELVVSEEYAENFKSRINSTTSFFVDFMSIKNNGKITFYELYTHKSPLQTFLKLQMIAEQYPDIDLRIIDENTYRRLKQFFKKKINDDERFVAWENFQYSLKTHPEDFS